MLKIEKWVENKQKQRKATFVTYVLYVISWGYKLLISFRHLLYDLNFIKVKEGPIRIVSIGNIVCGGTGKSEFVYQLIKDLKREDLAILTRGYRSKRKAAPRIVKDIDDGDEPFLLQSRLKNIPVIAGKKRELSAKLAQTLGAKFAILDDGMQYLKLKKDLSIVMIRALDPFGAGFVPYGMRRELLSKLKTASYMVIHGAKDREAYEGVKSALKGLSSAPIFGTGYFFNNMEEMIGKKVAIFCGIGNPEAFKEQLAKLKVVILKEKILADHEKIADLKKFHQECKDLGAEIILCTEKDYVKLTKLEQELVFPVKISMEVMFDENEYATLLDQILAF
jgi:tetraacyldisaccharide 4'-kinase